MRYGCIVDVQVNWYAASPLSNKQEGYAFISFEDYSAFEAVLMNPTHCVDGITLVCTKSNGGSGNSYNQHHSQYQVHHSSKNQLHHPHNQPQAHLLHTKPSQSLFSNGILPTYNGSNTIGYFNSSAF